MFEKLFLASFSFKKMLIFSRLFNFNMNVFFYPVLPETGRRQWQQTPVLLPGKLHGRKSLVGCSPLGSRRVGHNWVTSLSLSCIGEGKGNPLQCSCLENPRDGGAWWAAFYEIPQSQTWLKQLSSSNSQRQVWIYQNCILKM